MQTVSSSGQLVTDHLPYTAAVTNHLLGQFNLRNLIRSDDAVGYAHVGLVEAAARYRPEGPASFATFSYPRIRGAVMDGVRRSGATARLRLFAGAGDHRVEGGEHSADSPRDAPSRQSFRAYFDPTDLLEAVSLRASLLPAINALSDVERHVILLYYFEDLTFDRIATRLGLTKSYVARVHRRALPELARRLRKVGAEYGLVEAAQ
jgi:RNA polymerase sigma factor (sigma-70 family)